jgi:hypothetical protein
MDFKVLKPIGGKVLYRVDVNLAIISFGEDLMRPS